MQVIQSVEQMQFEARRQRLAGQRIVLVPTMGGLHNGHLSLMSLARERGDLIIASVFVNPTQFGPNEDFNRYPRQLDEDVRLCGDQGVHIVFAPETAEIYPPGFSTYVVEEKLGRGLEGVSRPGHFRGVTTVVAKLFNICMPDVALFGQKDAQQVAIIRKMVRDLAFPIEIVTAPTIRDLNGLAMSSRNAYLEDHERNEASAVFAALQTGRKLVEQGTLSVERIKAEVTFQLSQSRRLRINYIEIVDCDTMEPERSVRPGRSTLCVAVWLGQIRLIDNLIL